MDLFRRLCGAIVIFGALGILTYMLAAVITGAIG